MTVKGGPTAATGGPEARSVAGPARRPGIVWASPLPPTRSGIADYAVELLPELARLTEVAIVEPPGWEGDPALPWARTLERGAADATPPAGWDHLLHLGNNPYHIWIARRLRRFGGVAVMHDSVLHHLLVEEAATDQAWERFDTELSEAHGAAGRALAEARRWGFAGRLDPFLFPARQAYLRHARGVIVHNRRAAAAVAASCPGLPVRRVPLAVAALPAGDRRTTRSALGVGEDELLLVHLGFLTPAKGLGVLLHAMAGLAYLGVACRLLVVGEGPEREDAERMIERAGLATRISLRGWTGIEELGGIVSAADLGLVPRYPTAGETSAAALRFLAAGTPVAVAGYEQFLELPPTAAFRIPPGRAGAAELVRLVERLVGDAALRAHTRACARRVWEDGGHAPDRAAASLLAALADLRHDA